MGFVLFIILCILSFVLVQVVIEYQRRKEENLIPKPVGGNKYRVVECTIDDNRKFYVVESYYFSNVTKLSSWNYVTRTEEYKVAKDYCDSLNDRERKEFEEKRIMQELENTKNKKVIT